MAENNPAMMMMTAVLGQTVRLLPIIGEADKEATHLSTCSTRTLLTRGRDEIDKKNNYIDTYLLGAIFIMFRVCQFV